MVLHCGSGVSEDGANCGTIMAGNNRSTVCVCSALHMHFYPSHWVDVGLSLKLRSPFPWRYCFISHWKEVQIFLKSSCVCLVTCLWPTSFPNFTCHCLTSYSHQEVAFMWSHFSYFTLHSNIATSNFLTFTISRTIQNPNLSVVIYVIVAVFLASFPPHLQFVLHVAVTNCGKLKILAIHLHKVYISFGEDKLRIQ